MSVQSQIDRIDRNVKNALFKIAEKGVTVPSNANSDTLGELIAAIRAENKEILSKFSLYFVSSTDGGKTWGKAWEFGRIGSPPHLLLCKDGSVVVTYGRRRAPFGIRASISYDGCRTFGEEIILSEARNGDLGYPATTELADGSLVTVYYQPFEKDNRTSIFFTKWRA